MFKRFIAAFNARSSFKFSYSLGALCSCYMLNAAAQQVILEPEEAEYDEVVVLGSRIPRQVVGGPAPVYTQSGDALAAQGFSSAHGALKSFTQVTGASQNEQVVNSFTPNAHVVDLRALGPGRTLILVDGMRMAEYPMPYNGQSNFVNVANIPEVAIDHVEVLSGGASAIYGSDAVAGVVNFVLRKDLPNGFEIGTEISGTTYGDGQAKRLQALGGYRAGNINVTLAAEYLNQDPIYAYQRRFMDSVEDNPDPAGRIDTRAIVYSTPDLNTFVDLYIDPVDKCAPFPGLRRSERPGRGFFCGQSDALAQQTFMSGREQLNLYAQASMQFGNNELFGTYRYFHADDVNADSFNFWFPQADFYIYDINTGLAEGLQRYFLPFEVGGRDERLHHFIEETFDVSAGFKGAIGDSSWKYKATANYSRYAFQSSVRRLLATEVEDYFLGPPLPGLDPVFGVLVQYDVNLTRLYTPLTPEIYNSLSAIDTDSANSSTTNANVEITGSLLRLPAGSIDVAGFLEWSTQEYGINLDPRLVAGEFWSLKGTGGGGKRNRYATGAEMSVPLWESVKVTLAGRYDQYDDITKVNGAFTHRLGLEYRPFAPLLLRASAANSFRAPDMHYVFAEPSGFFTAVTDEYLCRRDEPNVPLLGCTKNAVPIEGSRQGNHNLTEEEGRSVTFGFVYEPSKELSFSLDFYNIDIDHVIVDLPQERILAVEADCQLGANKNGDPVDIKSGECQDALARVQRNDPNALVQPSELQSVTTGPINAANYRTTGFDAKFAYMFPRTPVGQFGIETSYTHVLKYDRQYFAGDPIEDHRDKPVRPDFDLRSAVRASLTWRYERLLTTFFAYRMGSTPNWNATGRVGALTICNLTTQYTLPGDRADIWLGARNVFDKDPPRDLTYNEYPYYSQNNYSATGRELLLKARYKF